MLTATMALRERPMSESREQPSPSSLLRFHRPSIDPADRQAVDRVLRSGWLTTGPQTLAFEREFGAYVGAPHAVGVTSATAAMHLAWAALGLKAGDEVITSPITFPSTASVLCHLGARPVFCDVDPRTLLMDPEDAAARVTPHTAGLAPVHFAGHPCAMDALLRLARRRRLWVVQDAAHAIEARHRGRPLGALGDAACYSFYANKNITTGEGGMLTTPRRRLGERARLLRLHGISRDAWKRYGDEGYRHWDTWEAGYKYNMFDLQAALGRSQLRRIERMWRRRRDIMAAYARAFEGDERFTMLAVEPHVRSAYNLCVLLLNPEVVRWSRDKVLSRVQHAGVGLGVHFRALHLHRYFRDRFGLRRGMFPRAEAASDRLLSIPLYPGLTRAEVARVVRTLRSVVR